MSKKIEETKDKTNLKEDDVPVVKKRRTTKKDV